MRSFFFLILFHKIFLTKFRDFCWSEEKQKKKNWTRAKVVQYFVCGNVVMCNIYISLLNMFIDNLLRVKVCNYFNKLSHMVQRLQICRVFCQHPDIYGVFYKRSNSHHENDKIRYSEHLSCRREEENRVIIIKNPLFSRKE